MHCCRFYLFFNLFLKLYFIDYAFTVVPIILPLPPAPSRTPHSLRQFWHLCLCPWVMHLSSLAAPFLILYCTSPWLFCNYLFVLLSPLTSSPIPVNTSPIWKPSKCSSYPRFWLCSFCLLSLFFRFNYW